MEMGMSKQAQAAQLERVRREMARRGLMAFSEYVQPWYRDAAHHRLTAQALEQVERYMRTKGQEGVGRLLIFKPPRHGKSQLAARNFPAWVLGRQPDSRVILASYGADLAVKHSRAVREIVTGPRFGAVFGERSALDAPVVLSDDSRSAQTWDLAAPSRGGMTAAGVGGAITGMGADLFIVDDPFKNREEVESEARRESVWEWWTSSAYTRLEDGAAVVGMLTRWHSDDWAGRLLKAMGNDPKADRYVVVNLPALAYEGEGYAHSEEEHRRGLMDGLWLDMADPLGRQAGEALWPEKYDEGDLESIRSNIGPYDWASLYQQQPRPLGGGFFHADWWKVIPVAPEGLMWVRYIDLALGKSEDSDRQASAGVAMDGQGNVFVRDLIKGNWPWHEAKERYVGLSQVEDAATVWGVEDVAFQFLAFQELARDRRLANRTIVTVRPEGSKVVRAMPLQARASMGKVYLVAGAWVGDFIREASEFPKGAHDDQVDTVTGGLQMIAQGYLPVDGLMVFDERVSISEF
jgi:predicted phage terminase large subunit-like protein